MANFIKEFLFLIRYFDSNIVNGYSVLVIVFYIGGKKMNET